MVVVNGTEADFLIPPNDVSNDAGQPPFQTSASPSPLQQQQQRRGRHRKRHGYSLWLLIVFGILFVSAMILSVVVVMKSAFHKWQVVPKELWINLQDSSSTMALPGCETTIVLMRHCEKYGPLAQQGKHNDCSYVGYERAVFLKHAVFGKRWPNPSWLYALSPQRGQDHFVHRQVETLTPLADKLNLSINTNYEEHQHDALAHDLFQKMQTGEMCGKIAVVSWTHRSLPQLASSLGCWLNYQQGGCPPSYPEESFDQVWLLKYVYNPQVALGEEYNSKNDKWTMYPSITQFDFDPLHFSWKEGDYPDGGVVSGGSWYQRSKRHHHHHNQEL